MHTVEIIIMCVRACVCVCTCVCVCMHAWHLLCSVCLCTVYVCTYLHTYYTYCISLCQFCVYSYICTHVRTCAAQVLHCRVVQFIHFAIPAYTVCRLWYMRSCCSLPLYTCIHTYMYVHVCPIAGIQSSPRTLMRSTQAAL